MSRSAESASTPLMPLLESKLHPPRLSAGLIERPDLLVRLDDWRSYKLTLIAAPAGFGKTTLVKSWLNDRQLLSETAWVSLDANDNDPIRFWHYVLVACQNWSPTTDMHALTSLLASTQLSLQPVPLETVLTLFINQPDIWGQHRLLVLEDYHVIAEPRIQETLGFLLAHLPETFHIIIVTRSEPGLSLERMRANGEVNEVQAAELRFSHDETSAFLQQTVAVPFSTEELEQLNRHLDGWVAGLRLFTLSLRGNRAQAQIEHILATFRGSQRLIRDYFVTEVLHVQPEHIQDFLLRTSVLTRLSPSLCVAVTGRKDSALLLEAIEEGNLFLEALDGTGEWYRYHALFAEAMQHEARLRLGEEEFGMLFNAASGWYEKHSMLSEAIETALYTETHERTAHLIEKYVQTLRLLEAHEHHTIQRWLKQLPESILKHYPLLCLSYAVALIFGRDSRESEQVNMQQLDKFLQLAEDGWQRSNDRVGHGRVLAFRAFLCLQMGKRRQALTWARQAIERLPEEEPAWRSMSLLVLGLDALQAGRLSEAQSMIQAVCAYWKVTGNLDALRGMTFVLGMICFERGELRQAAHYFRELQSTDKQHEDQVITYLGLAYVYYEWNTLDIAEQQLQLGLSQVELISDIPHEIFLVPRELVLACLQHARGETTLAVQRLTNLFTHGHLNMPFEGFYLYLYQEIVYWLVRFSIFLGDYASAQQWVNDFDRQSELPMPLASNPQLLEAPASALDTEMIQNDGLGRAEMLPIMQERKVLLQARLNLIQGRVEDSLVLLKELLLAAQEMGRGRNILQIKLLMALAYAARKQQTEAQQVLLEGVALGYRGDYQRTFLDEGDQMFLLLRELLPQLRGQPLYAYVQTLLNAFTQEKSETITIPTVSALFEPLTKQERRVLRLLVAGRSNQEIAQEMTVSVNTIRTQVQSIYRKLQVNNRQAASDVARHLHLL